MLSRPRGQSFVRIDRHRMIGGGSSGRSLIESLKAVSSKAAIELFTRGEPRVQPHHLAFAHG